MLSLPIVERELIVRARQGRTRWACVGVAAVAVLFTLQFFLLWQSSVSFNLAQQADYAFRTLAWMGFLMASASFLLTVDCVSSERREGTLGLLFLTRLRFVEVLAGKMAVHGLGAVYGLVTMFPALMLPVLAGGVTWRQVVQAALSLVSMLLFSLGLGIWASSGSGSAKHALKRALLWFGIIVFLPAFLSLIQARAGVKELAAIVGSLSPASAFVLATSAKGLAGASWALLATGPVFAAGFLIRSAAMLRSNWREELPANETTDLPVRDPAPVIRPFVAGDPIEWLMRRDRMQIKVLWLATALALTGPVLYVLIASLVGTSTIGVFSAFQLLAQFGSAMLFAWAGARFVLHARKEGAIELLRTTPAGATRIVAVHWQVLRNRLIAPLVVMGLLRVMQHAVYMFRVPSTARGMFLAQMVTGPLLVVMATLALCWLGIWFGLRARSPLGAVLWPVVLVPGLDMVVRYGCYIPLAWLANGGIRIPGSPTWISLAYFIVPPVVLCAKQLLLILWVRRRLRDGEMTWSAEPRGWRESSRDFFAWMAAGVRKARHWTPGIRNGR